MNALEQSTGAIVYRGPSRLDGTPIVVVATGLKDKSKNGKTGAMVQTWILRDGAHPVQAVHTGADAGICGECPLRPLNARGTGGPMCYVNKGFGPASVYRGLQAGIYPEATPSDVKMVSDSRGLNVRFGSYGDPGAVPVSLWRRLNGPRHTGYTHQWRRFPSLRGLAMASADSLADAREAWRRGWRTFRVIRSVDELQPNEILCPASKEAGRKTTCSRCGLCSGAKPNDRRKSIAIIDHGPTVKRGPRKERNYARAMDGRERTELARGLSAGKVAALREP